MKTLVFFDERGDLLHCNDGDEDPGKPRSEAMMLPRNQFSPKK